MPRPYCRRNGAAPSARCPRRGLSRWPPLWLFHRAEHGEQHRPPDADVIAFDALAERIMQPDRVRAFHKVARAARVDQRETARRLPETYGSAGGIGETGVGAE